jgi:hypothetical protein
VTTAERDDAERRLAELHAVRGLLLPDQDDPEVLSELVNVESQIRSAEHALHDHENVA